MSQRIKVSKSEASALKKRRFWDSVIAALLNERRLIDKKIKRCKKKIAEQNPETRLERYEHL